MGECVCVCVWGGGGGGGSISRETGWLYWGWVGVYQGWGGGVDSGLDSGGGGVRTQSML